MEIATLIIVCVSLFLHLVMSVFMVRMREYHEKTTKDLIRRVERLTKELTLRMPPRPYGVNVEEREADLSAGPMDWRSPV